MSLGTRLTAASDALFGRLARFRFRYDLFLSYARSDGKPYALKLRDQLKALDFSCFLDQDELPPGNSLRSSLSRALRRSATLVVIGTERALQSTYVAQEISEFTATGRTIIPIDFQGTLADPPWSVLRERDLVWIDETREALERGAPSPVVADGIDKLFKYTRRNVRVRGQILATAFLFLVGAAAAAWIINGKVRELSQAVLDANNARQAEERATEKAQQEARRADENRKKAEEQAKQAKQEKNRADEQTREAKRQEGIALKNAEQAEREQQRAEEKTLESQARLLATEAARALDGSTDGLIQSVLLAAESLRKRQTLEGRTALANGLRLLPPRPEAVLPCSCGIVRSAAFDPDGRRLAVGGDEGLAVLDPAEGWRELFPALKGRLVWGLAFSPDGRSLAAGTAGEVHVLEASTGRPLAVIPTGSELVRDLAFSPDGRYLAAAAQDFSATLLERGSEEDPWRPVVPTPSIQEGVTRIMSLAFSGDGRWLALGGANSVAIWDLARKEKAGQAESGTVWSIDFLAGGKSFRAAGDREIRFWRMEESADGGVDLSELQESRRNGEDIWALAPGPKESIFATGNRDGSVRLWGDSGGQERSRMILAQRIDPAVALTPDGQKLVVGNGTSLNIWQVLGSHELAHFAGVSAAAFSSSGRWLAVGGDRTLRLLQAPQTDTATGPESWPEAARWALDGEVSSVSISPDGRWLAAALGRTIQVIDTRTRGTVLRTEMESEDDLSALAFSPQGRWLVVTAGSAVHRIATGTWRAAPPVELQESLSRLAFSPDETWMGTRTELYYVRGEGLRRPTLTRIYQTATGRRVAWQSHEDEDLRGMMNRKSDRFEGPQEKQGGRMDLVRQVPSWREIRHETPKSVMSPDGQWQAKNEDDAVRLEETRSERTVERLAHDGLLDYSFSPDGRWLVTAGSGAVKVWSITTQDLIGQACARLPEDRRPAEWPEAVRSLMAPGPCVAAAGAPPG